MQHPPHGEEPDLALVVNASSGASPHLPHHIRDELALIGQLTPCVLPTIARDAATRVELATYPAALWIPAVEQADPMEGPEPAWQGWEWAPGEFLLVYVDRDPDLPRLGNLSVRALTHRQVVVAGSPMRVRLFAPDDPAWRGGGFAGEVSGFLDEATRFWAQSVAPSERRRDELLAIVCTLTRVEADGT